MLPVEKARLSHWITHTKSRVEAAIEMHTGKGAVAEGKIVMLQAWVHKLDALARDVRRRLMCIPGGEGPAGQEWPESEPESGSESEHDDGPESESESD